MPRPTSMRTAIAARAGRPCAVRGCPETRSHVRRYCERHYGHLRRHGHPTLQLPRRELAASWKLMRGLVERLAGRHPGIDRGIARLEQLRDHYAARALRQPRGPRADLLGREFLRLKEGGVSGVDLLTAVLAVWDLVDSNAWLSAAGVDFLDFSLAKEIFLLAPRDRRIDGQRVSSPHLSRTTAIRFGKALRLELVPLMVTIAEHLKRESLAREAYSVAIPPLTRRLRKRGLYARSARKRREERDAARQDEAIAEAKRRYGLFDAPPSEEGCPSPPPTYREPLLRVPRNPVGVGGVRAMSGREWREQEEAIKRRGVRKPDDDS